MEHNSVLTFRSTSTYTDSGENDKIEFITNASLTEKSNKFYASFNYPDEYNNVKATLKIEDGKVTLLKYGPSCTQYIFEKGKQHKGHYETDFGSLSVGIFSDDVNINLDENGGDINLKYRIYFNDLVTHSTDLSINLKRI